MVKIKEFLKAFKYVLLVQLISWGVFTFCDELPINQSNAELLAFIVALIMIGLFVIGYFVTNKSIVDKFKLNKLKFNIWFTGLWIFFSIAMIIVTGILVDNKYLHVCSGYGFACFLNGIEYSLFGFGLIASIILIMIIKLIIFIINKVKNKK